MEVRVVASEIEEDVKLDLFQVSPPCLEGVAENSSGKKFKGEASSSNARPRRAMPRVVAQDGAGVEEGLNAPVAPAMEKTYAKHWLEAEIDGNVSVLIDF